jgi:hypothetical protein
VLQVFGSIILIILTCPDRPDPCDRSFAVSSTRICVRVCVSSLRVCASSHAASRRSNSNSTKSPRTMRRRLGPWLLDRAGREPPRHLRATRPTRTTATPRRGCQLASRTRDTCAVTTRVRIPRGGFALNNSRTNLTLEDTPRLAHIPAWARSPNDWCWLWYVRCWRCARCPRKVRNPPRLEPVSTEFQDFPEGWAPRASTPHRRLTLSPLVCVPRTRIEQVNS